jgi:hypothetical protein
VKLHHLVKFYKKEQKVDEAEIHKFQAAFTNEKALLSSSRMIYAMALHKVDTLAESVKELTSENKKFKKKSQEDQMAKFSHNEKILAMSLQREKFLYTCEKEKRDTKEVSNRTMLEAKTVQMMLTHSLHKKSKDEDVLHQELTKKQKDVEVSKNVGTIATLLRSKQMNINNGQFNAHLSLDAVSFCFLNMFYSICLLTLTLILFYSAMRRLLALMLQRRCRCNQCSISTSNRLQCRSTTSQRRLCKKG